MAENVVVGVAVRVTVVVNVAVRVAVAVTETVDVYVCVAVEKSSGASGILCFLAHPNRIKMRNNEVMSSLFKTFTEFTLPPVMEIV